MSSVSHNPFPFCSHVTPALWEHRCTSSHSSLDPQPNNFYFCLVAIHNILLQMKKDRDARMTSSALVRSAAPARILLAIICLRTQAWWWFSSRGGGGLPRGISPFGCPDSFGFSKFFLKKVQFPFIFSVYKPNQCSTKGMVKSCSLHP